jgi:hypothetical protein
MKTTFKIAVLGALFVLMLVIDVPPQFPYPAVQFMPQAHAILGVRRRTAFRTAVVVESADQARMAQASQQQAAAQQQAMAAQQQAAAAQQQAAAAQKEAAAAKQQAAAAPPPAHAGAPLALGTVVAALPGGCASTPVGGVEYYYCSGNFYRAVFQGNQLVYVTAKP